MRIGIDASRSISGGAIQHLKGILLNPPPIIKKINKVYIWAPSSTLSKLPSYSWLVKISIDYVGSNILKKLFWQRFILSKICKKLKINILFNTDAGTICNFKPSLTLLQNILPFENKVISNYRFFQFSLYKILILRFIFLKSLKQTNHIIFLSNFSKEISNKLVNIKNYSIIPHGVDKSFYKINFKKIDTKKNILINALYVSNALIYKNQWNVISAISKIRLRYNINLKLTIVGGGSGFALQKMKFSKFKYDRRGKFIKLDEFVEKNKIQKYYQKSHIFIYASSCESFGISLLEALSIGIPIACSNKSSLPELINGNAVFFDPENVEDIISSIMKIITNSKLRKKISQGSKKRSRNYTWKKSSQLTWKLIYNVARKYSKH
jgi:glycosyltransferase involved in cell wall biosynthesis